MIGRPAASWGWTLGGAGAPPVNGCSKNSPVSAIGGLLIRGRVAKLREQIDPNATGGAILLGVRKPVVIAHGKSSPEGIANAVRLAQRAVDEQMVEKTATLLASAGVLRSVPAASVAQPDD